MEPFKALVLLAAAAIVSLVAAGAGGFYAGYSAGRGNLDEMKAYVSSVQGFIPAGSGGAVSLKPVLDDLQKLSKHVEALTAARADAAAGRDPGTKQILDEIKGLSTQIDGLRQSSLKPFTASPALIDRPGFTPSEPGTGSTASAATATALAVSQEKPEPAAVVFYDNVMLKRDQEKQYDEIGVRLALQTVGSREVRVAVNRQPFGLSFGERKVFRSQDVECEINLMETNLKETQARLSISCRR